MELKGLNLFKPSRKLSVAYDSTDTILMYRTRNSYALLGKAFDFPGWMKFEANPVDKAALEDW